MPRRRTPKHRAPVESVVARRVEGRQRLDELMRLGVGRAEDVRLLQRVWTAAEPLPPAQLGRLALECGFREEWRVENEDGVLAALQRDGSAGLAGMAPPPAVQLRQTQVYAAVRCQKPPGAPADDEAADAFQALVDCVQGSRLQLAGMLQNMTQPPTDEEQAAVAAALAQPLSPRPAEAAREPVPQPPSPQPQRVDPQPSPRKRRARHKPAAPTKSGDHAAHLERVRLELAAEREFQQRQEETARARKRAARRVTRWLRERRRVWAAKDELERRRAARRGDAAVMLARWAHRARRRVAERERVALRFRRHAAATQLQRLARLNARRAAAASAAAALAEAEAEAEPQLSEGHVGALQRACRKFLALREMDRKVETQQLNRRRARRRRWEQALERQRACAEQTRGQVLWLVRTRDELARVRKAARAERERLEREWRSWESKMTKAQLRKPLSDDWVPQMDESSSATFYLNLKTGRSQPEHPHMRAVRKLRATQRGKADEALKQTMERLQAFGQAIEARDEATRMELAVEAIARRQGLLG